MKGFWAIPRCSCLLFRPWYLHLCVKVFSDAIPKLSAVLIVFDQLVFRWLVVQMSDVTFGASTSLPIFERDDGIKHWLAFQKGTSIYLYSHC